MARYTIGALDKSLSLLKLVVGDGGERSVSELAAKVGLPASTAHRMVGTFEVGGFLVRIARGRYLPGPALLALGKAATLKGVLQAVSSPSLKALARQTGLTVHLGILEDDMVTYLLKAGRARDGLFTQQGMQLEAYCSAVGKILLSLQAIRERERYLESGPFVALTPHTITSVKGLRAELENCRRQGFARDEGEVHPLLRCIAIPVLDRTGSVIAALSLSAFDLDTDPQTYIEALRLTAKTIERRLFFPEALQDRSSSRRLAFG